MEISIFGAGSLGTLLGGLLADHHDVTLVGRDPHITSVREEGLRISGEIDRTVYPNARTTLPAGGDIALVTVKSFDTETAATALSERAFDAVLSLQNGMGNEELLATHCSGVLAGTCTYGAQLHEPGHVECTGIGEIVCGSPDGSYSQRANRVAEALSAGLAVTVSEEMPRRRWEKLAVNAGINAVTALARVPNGELVSGPATAVAHKAAAETARVATEAGIDIPNAPEQTLAVAETTAANTSSMQQDILAGRRTEIDAINGYIVQHASDPVPVNETLVSLVRAWERGRGLRESVDGD